MPGYLPTTLRAAATTAATTALALLAWTHCLQSTLHISVPPRPGSLAFLVRRAAFWAHLLWLLAVAGRRRAAALFLAFAAPFRLPFLGGDALSLANHLIRLLLFRRLGLSLPPRVPMALLRSHVKKNGMWARHKLDLALGPHYGGIYAIMRPGSTQDESSWFGSLVCFVSTAELAEQVLSDRVVFPGRGNTGFTELVGQGLLGLPTNAMWKRHRTIISKFMSASYLKAFTKTTGEEVEVLLGKWAAAASMAGEEEDASEGEGEGKGKGEGAVVATGEEGWGAVVNAHYDLSMATLDVRLLSCAHTHTHTTAGTTHRGSVRQTDTHVTHTCTASGVSGTHVHTHLQSPALLYPGSCNTGNLPLLQHTHHYCTRYSLYPLHLPHIYSLLLSTTHPPRLHTHTTLHTILHTTLHTDDHAVWVRCRGG